MTNEHTFFPDEALNTIRASRWTLFWAELLGKKSTHQAIDGTVQLCRWRGVTYFLNYEEPDND